MNFDNLVKRVLYNNPYMAALVVDKNGTVIFINDAYLKFLKLPRYQVIGKDIRDITPETRTIEAIEKEKEIMCYEWKVNDGYGIACSVPLFEEGEVVGALAYSIFMDSWDNKIRENVVSRLINQTQKSYHTYTARYNLDSLIGEDKVFKDMKYLAREVSQFDGITVLLTGESGTGKELFAQAIHNHSRRAHLPFVRVNCAGIPDNLLEAELFGYEAGAYTGAQKKGKPGKFEIADKGTIFLDEIGEMPLSMQSKVLVFLQEREIERLGGNRPIRLDVRVIAATNRILEQMVEDATFRQDLYYRLNVVRIDIPPLRNRKQDIPLLVEYFIEKIRSKLGLDIASISDEALNILIKHKWSGNVRELENVLERAIIMSSLRKSSIIDKNCLSFSIDNSKTTTNLTDLKSMINAYEKKIITQILNETSNDKIEAAKYLGINLSSLYRKAKKYGID